METPEIQIIIPAYKCGRYIRRCLDSLTAQSFKSWQAILVDDCSPDNSTDIIREYMKEDERIVLYKTEKNGGAAAARNLALDKITAPWVAFLDSDDYWEPDMLETLYNKAMEHNADVVQSRFIYDFPGGKKVLPKGAFRAETVLSGKELKKVYIRMMTGINMNHVCMKLIKASLIDSLRFDTSLKTAEDLKFCINLFKNVKKYVFTDKVLYHYVRNESSITGSGLPASEKLRANREVSGELIRALPVWGIDNLYYRALSSARPYIITVSKIFRMIREKILRKAGE